MLSYFKKYRKWVGGKWYKVLYHSDFGVVTYYTKTKPNKLNHFVIRKYRYES